MKNTYDIIWSDEAYFGLKQIFQYLENRFSENTVRKFALRFDSIVDIISTKPLAFPISAKSNKTRRAVVAKLTSIYYTFDGETVRVLSVLDNRMDPNKIRFD